jgi:hypothetical protein
MLEQTLENQPFLYCIFSDIASAGADVFRK